jgi:DNA-binding beta-propeller fold protein YncE
MRSALVARSAFERPLLNMHYRYGFVLVLLLAPFGRPTPAFGAEATTASANVREPRSTSTMPTGSPSAPLTGLFLGYSLPAGSPATRPILGIPGAVVGGRPMPLGGSYKSLAVSSVKGYVLGVRGAGRQPVIIGLPSVTKSLLIAREIPGLANVDRIVLSPTGSAAVLYGRARQSIVVLRDLPQNPRVASEISTRGLPNVATALAVSDDGGAVVAAISGVEGDAVFLLSPLAAPRRLTAVRRAVALAFRPASRDLYAADSGRDRILRIEEPTTNPLLRVVADATQGVSDPVAVAVSDDGAQVIVVNRGSDSVLVLSLVSGDTQSLQCYCQPVTLHRLREPNTFGLAEAEAGTVAIVNARPDTSAIFFVPPPDHLPFDASETVVPRRR